MSALRVYLAGPDVFLPDAAAVLGAKQQLCASHGFIGMSPLDNGISGAAASKRQTAMRISEANENLMRRCDLLIANLTPFRGPSADVGTGYELGFARALGLPVFAYTNVAGSLIERTRHDFGSRIQRSASGRWHDEFDMAVEDFDCEDNLMLIGALHGSGTTLVVNPTPSERRFVDLAGFETCLKLAVQQCRPGNVHDADARPPADAQRT